MNETINKQVLDLWNRYKPTIAVDAIEYDSELRQLLNTNLTEVGTDTISRQAAIDAVNCVMVMKGIRSGKSVAAEAVESAKSIIADNIRQLPPIQPKRGKWIKISPANIYECSECGKHVMTNDICAYDFCHGCGADMRGEQK